jgi:hypothetical protein
MTVARSEVQQLGQELAELRRGIRRNKRMAAAACLSAVASLAIEGARLLGWWG